MHANSIKVQKTARYFTWGNVTPDTRTLWFICHGYGQLAEYFIKKFAILQDEQTVIVAPEALNRFYLSGFSGRVGASWMTREDRQNDIDDYIQYLNQLYDHVLSERNPQELHIRILGFSQGAATVCRWVADGKVKLDKLILWAGVFPPDLDKEAWFTHMNQIPLTVVLGSRDELIAGKGVEEYVWEFRRWGLSPEVIQFDGGHEIDTATLLEIK